MCCALIQFSLSVCNFSRSFVPMFVWHAAFVLSQVTHGNQNMTVRTVVGSSLLICICNSTEISRVVARTAILLSSLQRVEFNPKISLLSVTPARHTVKVENRSGLTFFVHRADANSLSS